MQPSMPGRDARPHYCAVPPICVKPGLFETRGREVWLVSRRSRGDSTRVANRSICGAFPPVALGRWRTSDANSPRENEAIITLSERTLKIGSQTSSR